MGGKGQEGKEREGNGDGRKERGDGKGKGKVPYCYCCFPTLSWFQETFYRTLLKYYCILISF